MTDQRHPREILADASHFKKAAAHKGRCHFHAHQRRAMAKAKRDAARATEKKRVARMHRHKGLVAAYWRGEREDHP